MAEPRRKVGGKAGKIGWRFDGRNPAAVAFAERSAARYVTRVSAETRSSIQNLIVRSIQDGISPRDTAKLIKATVGLTSRSAAAVKAYHQVLLARGDVPARAWKLTERYSEKLLKARAKMIARTEIMGALNAGSLEQARQRMEAGIFINPQKKWMITKDEITCRICRPLEGQTQPLMTTFTVGVQAPPAHPNCRCTLTFFDKLPKVKVVDDAFLEMFKHPKNAGGFEAWKVKNKDWAYGYDEYQLVEHYESEVESKRRLALSKRPEPGDGATAREIMEFYKEEQAWNKPIEKYLKTKGLTLEDYEEYNKYLHHHNISSGAPGGETEKALLNMWNSDSGPGRAMREMSEWQEWQAQNFLRPPQYGQNWLKEAKDPNTNWRNSREGKFFKTHEEYVTYMEDIAKGKTIYYRKGTLDRRTVSTTIYIDGAVSGSSSIKPDHAYTFDQMTAAGYRMVSGMRGLVGIVSGDEGEVIWLKP